MPWSELNLGGGQNPNFVVLRLKYLQFSSPASVFSNRMSKVGSIITMKYKVIQTNRLGFFLFSQTEQLFDDFDVFFAFFIRIVLMASRQVCSLQGNYLIFLQRSENFRRISKGQIISKGLFGILGFFQKTNEEIRFSFVRSLEESEDTKSHFEII